MRKIRTIFTVMSIAFASLAASAQDVPFFDTSRPAEVLTLGLRAGMSSSGIATNYLSVQPEIIQSNFYWRSGMQIGGVADLNIRNFLALQVGLFWEYRGYDSALMAATAEEDYMGSMFARVRFHYINIPIMLSFRFNILPQATWQVDVGGYWAHGVGGKKKMDSYIAFGAEEGNLLFDHTVSEPDYFHADPREFLAVKNADGGIRVGTGLTFFRHYVIGIYYQRSLRNIAKNYDGGPDYKIRNCCWSVNVGYNF